MHRLMETLTVETNQDLLADLIQTKGLRRSFQLARKRWMASIRAERLQKMPRRIARRLRIENQVST